MLLAGTRVGPYVVDRMIGGGGMGVVYRAHDPRLDRDVAIKLIRSEQCDSATRRRRFETEARSVARLTHPNVVAIHDVGEEQGTPYIVTELVDGGTLADRINRGPMSVSEFLPMAMAMAEALAYAHERGIVHRDLKPANILLTLSGSPKISDFGLAKCLDPALVESKAATATSEGVVMGTPAYMSPEQAAGRAVDFRSDLYSFGAVLVEMLTGERAFLPGERQLPGGLPPSLGSIIERCLAMDPHARYQKTADLVDDLRDCMKPRQRSKYWLLAGIPLVGAAIVAAILIPRKTLPQPPASGGKIESLAILPLQNLSPDPAQSYFADAMTEQLTAELASLRSLSVISRTSATSYRGSKKPLREIASELGVDGLIEGSVIRDGDKARVTVQLIDGRTDRHVWAQTFDRRGADILALQRDVAADIVKHIRITLSPAEREHLSRIPTQNLDAYQAFLRAQYKLTTALSSERDAADALRYAEEAASLDPGFAEAQVAIADASLRKAFSWKGGREYDEKAYLAIEKALALNPSLPNAYVIRGNLQYGRWRGFNIAAAIADYRKALALNPNFAPAHHQLCSELNHIGLHDEAIAECTAAISIDPQIEGAKLRLGRAQWQSNRFADAVRTYERFHLSRFESAVALAYAGRVEDARRTLEAAVGSTPEVEADLAAGKALLAALQHDPVETARQTRLSAGLGAGNPHFHHAAVVLAAAWAELAKPEEAVRWMRFAADNGMPNYPLFTTNPSLRKLRGHGEYDTFMASLKPRWEQIVSQIER